MARWPVFVFALFLVVLLSGCTGFTGNTAADPRDSPDFYDNLNNTAENTSGLQVADKCEDVVCEDSAKTCTGGLIARCKNTCSPGIGECSICEPKCLECLESWSCSNWSPCQSGIQARTCTDKNECGTEEIKPQETRSCASQPQNPKITSIQYETTNKPERDNLNEEWIEITGYDTSMDGWTMSDDSNHIYTFPDFVINGAVKIHTGRGENNQTDLYWNRNSAVWNNNGDTAKLIDNQGNTVDKFDY